MWLIFVVIIHSLSPEWLDITEVTYSQQYLKKLLPTLDSYMSINVSLVKITLTMLLNYKLWI